MSAGLTFPVVMAALVVAFRRISLDGEVRDGPEVGSDSAREVIVVGFVPPAEDNSGEAEVASGGLGPRDRETYDIHCVIAVGSGDPEIPPVRARAAELLGACRDQLIADPTLGRTCMQARVSSWSLREDMTDGGPVVQIRLDVHVEAFTTR